MGRTETTGKGNLFDGLLKRRDGWREMMKGAKVVIRAKDLSLENNRMGLQRWYLHPDISGCAIRNFMFWMQEIPPGGRSGKQKVQGGRIHYVWEGRGYSIIDGVKHEWEEEDLIMLPVKPSGTEHQHFNTDPERWAKLVVCECNWCDELGIDLGSGFEQLEDSPDYRP